MTAGRRQFDGECPDFRGGRRAVVLALAAALLSLVAPIRADEPLFQQEPFDVITLNEQAGGAALRVRPLELPDRKVPAQPPAADRLTVRLLDRPDKQYELAWGAIAKVELFEQLVLAKARELVAAGELDEAFEYYRYLEGNHPKLAGLGAAVEECLYEEAKAAMRKQDFAATLAALRELHRRDPQRPGLDKAMGASVDKLVQKHLAADDPAAARKLLRGLAACYADHPVAAQGEEKLRQAAARLLDEAKAAQQSGDLRQAAARLRQIARVWPATAGAKELAQDVHARWPRLVVAASAGAATNDPRPSAPALQSWAERRTARLLGRSLCEFTAPGANGGKYLCPVAEVAVAKPPLRITLTVKPELPAGAAGPTAYDLARAIAAAEGGRLGAATAGLRATDRDRLLLDLRQPVARPDALLAAVSLAHGPAAASAAAYRAAETAGREAVFLANPGYFAAAATQPKELIELRCDDDAAALRALRIGLADVADRLPPGEAARLRSDPRFVVQPYNVPLVHCLVPNLRRPLPADRAFRRALVYGMHRQAILAELDGSKLPGCRMLSGPFPLGLAGDDPLRYAADPQIEPRPYDPEMAAALALGAWRQFAAAEKARGRKAGELSLVLMHPARPLPRAACAEMQGQWKLLGIAVELRETPALPARIPDDVDLLYVEAFVSEPLLDAAALLGPDGPAGGCSPAMALALRRLEQAADFAAAQARLREIHRLAFEETAVLPLWQWPEFFARRADLQGAGDSIATLYQNIEQWQPGFAWPAE